MASIPIAPPPSSRIFVKNLPPNLREEDFKQHFAKIAPTTDVKFIPRRRIGYVGYRSSEEAAKAVKYFHRSFIRMSKIAVELAKPVGEIEPRKRYEAQVHSPEKKQVLPSAEAERNSEAKERNVKLDEFLEVMAPSSKSRTWANEDTTGAVEPGDPIAQDIGAAEDGGSEQEYQMISKKRKRSAQENETEGTALKKKSPRLSPVKNAASDVSSAQTDGLMDNQIGLSDLEAASEKEIDEANNPTDEARNGAAAPVSDSDWLRSKTSRLLGLVDDEEFDETRQAQSEDQDLSKVQRLERDAMRQASQDPSVSDAVSQTNDEPLGRNDRHDNDDLPPKPVESAETPATNAESTGRLFLRNLPYNATEADLGNHFSGYGSFEEVHVSRDTRTGSSKGFGYVQFSSSDEATLAMQDLDGKPFQGRLLHILPAAAKKESGLDEYAISKLPLKKQQQIQRKVEASRATFKWNSMYMNPDAIVSSIAERLGIPKAEVLDPTSADAAVNQAHAETTVIQEAKNYFAGHGVDLGAFKKRAYDDRAVLVKNFPYGTTAEEIKRSFEAYGTVTKMLMPPSATIAIVEMEQSTQARAAFKSMAYRKFKDTVLFLEKAPKGLFEGSVQAETSAPPKEGKPSTSELLEQPETATGPVLTSTLFIRNLNFSTTSKDLEDLFKPLNGFLSARVKTKTNPKKPSDVLSMGFGFVEFRSKADAQAALKAINGYKLAGHELIIKESHKALDAADERRREDVAKKMAGRRTKIIVKNLPFEATKKDVRSLFGSYGQLRSVRVPKKFDNSSRGFAFADFVTTKEAENAIKALEGVHLLGRRLNLDFASEELVDPEQEIEKMQKKVGKQADKVAVQNLTSGGRRKFAVQQNEDAEIN